MGFLRFLLIAAVVYFLFRLIVRILFPFFVSYLFKKTQTHIDERFKGNSANTKRREGEVTIEYPEEKKDDNKKTDGRDGEYVDYEEIK